MAKRLVGTGFGHGKFGHHPFGHADFGEQVIVQSFNPGYLEDDAANGDRLMHYLIAAKNSVNRTKASIDSMADLMDPLKIRDDILRFLGTTIDVVLDDAEPKEYKRSLVNNAVLFYQLKGTDKAFNIRGRISGFDVTVQNLYRFDPVYRRFLSEDDIHEIPLGSGKFYTERAPGSLPGLPTQPECDYCLTSFIRIQFLILKPLPPSTSVNFFDRLIRKLKDIIPIHVSDVLYELQLIVSLNEHDNLKMNSLTVEEVLHIPMHVFHRFDAIPADMIALDQHGYINGTIDIT